MHSAALARRSPTIAMSAPDGFVPHSMMLFLLDRGLGAAGLAASSLPSMGNEEPDPLREAFISAGIEYALFEVCTSPEVTFKPV